MFSSDFWISAFERAIRTFAQTAVAIIGVDMATSIVDLDWPYIAGVGATAAALSLLTSVAANKVGNPGPSLAKETVV